MTHTNKHTLHFRPAGLLGVGPLLKSHDDSGDEEIHVSPAGLLGMGPLMERRRVEQSSVPVSNILTDALRKHGWWALASQVKEAQGLAPPSEPTLANAVEALAMKLAADRATNRAIRAGLDALDRVRRAQ